MRLCRIRSVNPAYPIDHDHYDCHHQALKYRRGKDIHDRHASFSRYTQEQEEETFHDVDKVLFILRTLTPH